MPSLSAIFVLKVLSGILISPAASLSPPNIDTSSSADIKKYPYHVSIEFTDTPRVSCAGATISKNYVLTTANCVKYKAVDAIRIRAGTTTRLKGGTVYNVETVIAHEDYKFIDGGWRINDIAVVRIKGIFNCDASHKSIRLFNPGERAQAGAPANITGWGGNDELPELKAANETIIDSLTCDRAYSQAHGTPSKIICAGMGACYNDPGDPIVLEGRLAGVATMNVVDCGKSFPGVFTEVANFRDWIDRHVEYSECNGAERLEKIALLKWMPLFSVWSALGELTG